MVEHLTFVTHPTGQLHKTMMLLCLKSNNYLKEGGKAPWRECPQGQKSEEAPEVLARDSGSHRATLFLLFVFASRENIYLFT